MPELMQFGEASLAERIQGDEFKIRDGFEYSLSTRKDVIIDKQHFKEACMFLLRSSWARIS